MRLLLDTHTVLLWRADQALLSQAARVAMANEAIAVLVIAAGAWEIATKQSIEKLPALRMPTGGLVELVAADSFGHLPVSAIHAWHAGALDWAHRDPFDRMLAAQARTEELVLVTRDPAFAALRIPTIR